MRRFSWIDAAEKPPPVTAPVWATVRAGCALFFLHVSLVFLGWYIAFTTED